jgi:predicted DNA binding CopG/RHH family protein
MAPVPADAFINCRVDSETKSLVRVLADRQGITESRLVKDMLEAMLRNAATAHTPTPPTERLHRDARVYVRLTPEDLRLLTGRASARHMPAATYVSLLLRTHLHGLAPLPKAEYAALKESVSELSAIGRNLNQIARIMNEGGRATPPGRAEVAAMLKVAVGLRDHFKALLRANARSWIQGAAASQPMPAAAGEAAVQSG